MLYFYIIVFGVWINKEGKNDNQGGYMSLIKEKLKEISMSVIPVSIIVLLINFTLVPMENDVIIRFLIGSVLTILGLTIFLLGVDIGITPFGEKLVAF